MHACSASLPPASLRTPCPCSRGCFHKCLKRNCCATTGNHSSHTNLISATRGPPCERAPPGPTPGNLKSGLVGFHRSTWYEKAVGTWHRYCRVRLSWLHRLDNPRASVRVGLRWELRLRWCGLLQVCVLRWRRLSTRHLPQGGREACRCTCRWRACAQTLNDRTMCSRLATLPAFFSALARNYRVIVEEFIRPRCRGRCRIERAGALRRPLFLCRSTQSAALTELKLR